MNEIRDAILADDLAALGGLPVRIDRFSNRVDGPGGTSPAPPRRHPGGCENRHLQESSQTSCVRMAR